MLSPSFIIVLVRASIFNREPGLQPPVPLLDNPHGDPYTFLENKMVRDTIE
jgi:hypothetical protein